MRELKFVVTRYLQDDDDRTQEEVNQELLMLLNVTTVEPLTEPQSAFTGRRHRPVIVAPEPDVRAALPYMCPLCQLSWSEHPHAGCRMPAPLAGDPAGVMKTAETIASMLQAQDDAHDMAMASGAR